MRLLSLLLAVAGFVLAIVLFAQHDVGAIVASLVTAAPGLLLAALVHVLPMVANARAWQRLIAEPRPSLFLMAFATWIRESVNGLLPVARVGGEIVAYRVVRTHAERRADVAATLLVDMAISVLSQAIFGLFGLALLFFIAGTAAMTTQLIWGIAAMIAVGIGFAAAQRSRWLSVLTRLLDRLFAGQLARLHMHSQRIEGALRAVHKRRRDVAGCFVWQLVGWVLGAGEIWLALYFLRHPSSLLEALAIEALIQAVSSASFLVPAAIGVQEGAFVVIGGALGIDAATALALASARRLRDVVVFFPGLIAWQWAEASLGHDNLAPASPNVSKQPDNPAT